MQAQSQVDALAICTRPPWYRFIDWMSINERQYYASPSQDTYVGMNARENMAFIAMLLKDPTY